MSFSEDIKRTRQELILSQTEFAKELGVSFATVNRWESGKSKPTYKTLRLIDEYCKQHNIPFSVQVYTEELER